MADPRTLTEDEHNAIVADRVSRETASLTAQISGLESEKAELVRQVETANAAAATEKARADQAVSELDEFKKTIEAEKEVAARKDARIAEAKEIAKHLPEQFWSPERSARLAGMPEDDWKAYLGDLREQAGLVTPGAPRETAMTGTPGGTPPGEERPSTGTVLGAVFGRKGA